MKEDILEQAVDDWLLSQEGVFTKHNVKFKPDPSGKNYDSNTDCVNSDIDILALNPNKKGINRVIAVTCKSWQSGINLKTWANDLIYKPNKKMGNREVWKSCRELVIPKWTKAFVDTIKKETNSIEFTYMIACTKLNGDKNRNYFEKNNIFINKFKKEGARKVAIKVITFNEIYKKYKDRGNGHTLESTQLGRLLQIIKASGAKVE